MNVHHSAALRVGAFAGAIALAGCTNMSGLSGSSSFSCKAPEGVICDSVSGNYANAVQNNLPSQKPRSVALATKEGTATAAPAGTGAVVLPLRPTPTAASAATPMMPARSSARVLRLWFKPWEDADRDLYDQGFVYVQIDSGGWLIEHVQRQIREAHAPLRPPPRGAPAGDGKEPPSPAPLSKNLPRPAAADTPLQGWAPPAARPDSTD
ncbi:MAG: TraV family lipoprotein [Burkholderiales bacterium]|nr:TraV family lipoprotein [Burkholderiales bacterium]